MRLTLSLPFSAWDFTIGAALTGMPTARPVHKSITSMKTRVMGTITVVMLMGPPKSQNGRFRNRLLEP
ncbi:MAG: hypothetical protein ACKN85_06445 [Pirellula sp.]